MDATIKRAAIYTRISRDDDRDDGKLGVKRQREDCTALARLKRWDVAEIYEDNDTSASNGKERKDYQRMLRDVERGRVNAIVVWDVDRLTRTPSELEHVITLADKCGVALASVGGEVDLATAQGRLTSRIKGAVARHEVEQMSRRIRRAFDQKAAAGEPHGMRTYGWRREPRLDDDGNVVIRNDRILNCDVIDDAEAAVIREATERVIRGEALRKIAGELNARDVPSPRGVPWNSTTLRQVLKRPRNAGRRVHRGEVVGSGNWKPIVKPEVFDRLLSVLNSSERKASKTNTSKYLLSGLARCGRCDGPMRALVTHGRYDVDVYVCAGCHRVRRDRQRVDDLVTRVVVGRLARPDAARLLARDDDETRSLIERRDALRARLDNAADDYGAGKIDNRQLTRISAKLRPQIDALDVKITGASSVPELTDLCRGDVAEIWGGVPLERQRALINALVTITILPVGRGRRWDPRSIDIRWRATSS